MKTTEIDEAGSASSPSNGIVWPCGAGLEGHMNIPLGFEIGSGDAVSIPLKHMAVAGTTQESGKTTTLEALVTRANVPALAFITKRGERSFEGGNRIPVYFDEGADGRPYWEFVESIVASTMGQRMKFERAWIVRAARGASSLAEVRGNVASLMAKSKRSMDQDIYMLLGEYLDIVLPQIERLPPSRSIDLSPGLNVMDLTPYTEEMQMLLVRSAVSWVHRHAHGVVTILPEAWKFIPEGRMTPVKPAAERLIREGAGLGNFVWIDSQDIAGVSKLMLRAASVWLIGVQREANEIKRTLANIPGTIKKPSASDVAMLGKGQFYACWRDKTVKTYVWPAWMEEEEARSVALGSKRVEDATRTHPIQHPPTVADITKYVCNRLDQLGNHKPEPEEDMAALEETNKRLDDLIGLLSRNQGVAPPPAPALVATSHSEANGLRMRRERIRSSIRQPLPVTGDEEAMYQRFKTRLLAELPSIAAGRPITVTPPEKLRKDFQRQEADRIVAAARALSPLAKRVLKLVETTDDDNYISQKTIADRLGRSNTGNAAATLAKAIDELRNLKFIEVKDRTGTRRALYNSIAADLAFYKATQPEVDAVYQTVLYELATSGKEE